MKLNEVKKVKEDVKAATAAQAKAKSLTQQGHDAERMGDEKAMRRKFADAAAEKLKIKDAMKKTENVNEISDKLALSYAKKAGTSQDSLDTTTDDGHRKFWNRQKGQALALDKMHQPHRRVAKVGTGDANAKDAAYRKLIGEDTAEKPKVAHCSQCGKGFSAAGLKPPHHTGFSHCKDHKGMKIVAEGKKAERMIKHVEKSEEDSGKSKAVAKKIAYATANKRGMLDNKNKKKTVKEAHMVTMHVEDDHEVSMAQGDLYEMAKKAIALHKMLDSVDQLEGWVQAKITLAADYISTVHDYLDHAIAMQGVDIEEPVHEAIVPTGTSTSAQKLPPQTRQMVQKVSAGLNKNQSSVMTDKDGNVSVVNKKDTPKMAQAGMMTVDEASLAAELEEGPWEDAGRIVGSELGSAGGKALGDRVGAGVAGGIAGSALGGAAGTAAGKWVDKKLGLGEEPRKSVEEEAAEISRRMFGKKDSEGQGWGTSDTSAAINSMKDHIRSTHGGRYNPDTIEDAAMDAASTFYQDMGYDNVEDAAEALVGHFVRRWMSGSLRAD